MYVGQSTGFAHCLGCRGPAFFVSITLVSLLQDQQISVSLYVPRRIDEYLVEFTGTFMEGIREVMDSSGGPTGGQGMPYIWHSDAVF